ncbi:MAG: hypothetical protein RLZZ555_1378 [Pseudomonadota bacterium]
MAGHTILVADTVATRNELGQLMVVLIQNGLHESFATRYEKIRYLNPYRMETPHRKTRMPRHQT